MFWPIVIGLVVEEVEDEGPDQEVKTLLSREMMMAMPKKTKHKELPC